MNQAALTLAESSAVTNHIQIVQGIINRLANNSASCKGWCLTLVTALLGLAASVHQPALMMASVLPVAVFAGIDAMYLAQERAYRRLYAEIVARVRSASYDESDFYRAGAPLAAGDLAGALRSWSIWPVYGLVLAILALVWFSGLFDIIADP